MSNIDVINKEYIDVLVEECKAINLQLKPLLIEEILNDPSNYTPKTKKLKRYCKERIEHIEGNHIEENSSFWEKYFFIEVGYYNATEYNIMEHKEVAERYEKLAASLHSKEEYNSFCGTLLAIAEVERREK